MKPTTELTRSTNISRAAQAWSTVGAHNINTKTRWWFHHTVIRHINQLISGTATAGIVSGDISFLRAKRQSGYNQAISVGCGNGFKELSLLRAGVVAHFTLYEIAASRIEQAKAMAAEYDLLDRVDFKVELCDFNKAGRYDLVYWNNSLHHMPDVLHAVQWSRRTLVPGGDVYINDCIAPSRLQYSDAYLAAASRFRSILPERLIGHYPRTAVNIDPVKLEAADPSECADSSSIVPSINKVFPTADMVNLGGLIYSCALNGIIANFTPDDEPLMQAALQLDEQYARQGLGEYMRAFARVG